MENDHEWLLEDQPSPEMTALIEAHFAEKRAYLEALKRALMAGQCELGNLVQVAV